MRADDVSTGEPLSEELKDKLLQLGKPIKPTLHTIKPLEWKQVSQYYYSVRTFIGTYTIDIFISGDCKWSYIDGSITYSFSCTSIEDGKAQAEKHYGEQLGKCLVVYNG